MSATSQVCQDFFHDPTHNPRTGRKITKGKLTYNKLVRECGDPEQTQQYISNPTEALINAAFNGDNEIVGQSLEAGADINATLGFLLGSSIRAGIQLC